MYAQARIQIHEKIRNERKKEVKAEINLQGVYN